MPFSHLTLYWDVNCTLKAVNYQREFQLIHDDVIT